jgi:hypothetical protein
MKSFKGYIVEVAQQGFQYEVNAAKVLKPLDIVPTNFTPAGAGSDQPDLLIKRPDKGLDRTAGCELKITAASAGSLVLKYDSGRWSIGNPNETDEEKLFIMDLAKEVGIVDQINKLWTEEPIKGTGQRSILKDPPDEKKGRLGQAYISQLSINYGGKKTLTQRDLDKLRQELNRMGPHDRMQLIKANITNVSAEAEKINSKFYVGSLSKREMYQRDLKLFKDIKGEIPATKIEEYYNKKNTYYINVGTHGFYLLGPNNPLNLRNIPSFGSAAKATYRARVQYKGGDNYQFTFEMQFSIPAAKKSPYNIAPVVSKTNVEIDTNSLDLSFMRQ